MTYKELKGTFVFRCYGHAPDVDEPVVKLGIPIIIKNDEPEPWY